MNKKEECHGCIGLTDEHTCEGHAEFLAMKAEKDKCQNCSRLQARIETLEGEWTTDKPTEPGYYWWRQGDRIEPCEIRRVSDTLEAWFIGEADPLIDWQWQPDWRWMKSATKQGESDE